MPLKRDSVAETHTDYREYFAHLLEHMVRKVDVPCERHCPVQHHEDGGMEYSYAPRDNYEGPSIENLFVALKEVGYAVGILSVSGPKHHSYLPTALGIAFLERYRHPQCVWFKENWFAAIVAVATLALAVASIFFS